MNRTMVFVALGMIIMSTNNFMVPGLITPIAKYIDQPITYASFGLSAFSLTFVFSTTFFSFVLSQFSSKRSMQVGLILFLLGNFITLLASHIFLFVMGRIITAVGSGIFIPLCTNLAMEMGSKESRGKTLSYIWAASSSGVVFGVPLMVYVANEFQWQHSFALIIVFSIMILFGLSHEQIKPMQGAHSTFKERLGILKNKKVLFMIITSMITAVASLGLFSFVSQIGHHSSQSLSTLLFVWGVGGFVGSSFVGLIIDRIPSPHFILNLILGGLMISMALIALGPNHPLNLASYFFWGLFGWASTSPTQYILFSLGENHKTLLTALNSSAMGLGSTFGTIIFATNIHFGMAPQHLPLFAASLMFGLLLIKGFFYE
jgi:predicted MFS family arabinose efflux permease